jgi:hypothetical protein
MKRKTVALLFILALVFPASTTLLAADQVVLRVIVVKTDNPDGYVKELEKGKALLKKLGSSAVIRVWRARFAGPETGSMVVSVEYPSLAAVVKDEAAAQASAEYQAWFKGLDKIRHVTSDSLYNELTP